MGLKVGETVGTSIWLDGNETPEKRAQYEEDVRAAIEYFCQQEGVVSGPIKWIEKHPEDSDVPPVPKHIQGERVRLLCAEAIVESLMIQTSKGSFIAELEKKDLELLRKITRRALPNGVNFNDKDIDAFIEEIGPEAAMAAVRKHYEKRLH